jgi:hypothetical protein
MAAEFGNADRAVADFRAEKLCAGSPRRETALPGSRIRSLA